MKKMFLIRTDVLHKNPFVKFSRYNESVRNPKNGNKSVRNIVSERVRLARLAFDPPLTQDQLSGRLAVKGIVLDRVAITKIESGQRCVFDFELPVLAEALKVDVRWLLAIQTSGGPAKQGRGQDGL